MKTGLITSDTYKNHNTGDGHPEKMDRVSIIIENFNSENCLVSQLINSLEQVNNETWISLDTTLLSIPQDRHIEVLEDTKELLGTRLQFTERKHYDLAKLKIEIH